MNNVEKSKQLTAEQIEVMAAFLEGKEIEVQEKSGNSANEIWLPEPAPTWDWHNFDYRVKSETLKKRIVPYKGAKEFLTAQKEHGPYLRNANNIRSYRMPIQVFNFELTFAKKIILIKDRIECESTYTISFSELLTDNWQWQDGTPCGKEVEV